MSVKNSEVDAVISGFPDLSREVSERKLKIGRRELISLDFVTLNERLVWASGKMISRTCFLDYKVITKMKGSRQMPLDSRRVLNNYIWKKI